MDRIDMNQTAGQLAPFASRLLGAACVASGTLASAAGEAKPKVLLGHKGAVHAVAFLPDGRLVTGGFDKLVRLWNVESAAVERTLEGHEDTVLAIAASPDGKHIATAGKDRAIKLWDLASSDPPKDLSGHRKATFALVFSPDGKLLASCGEDDTRIMLWDVEQAKSVKQLEAQDPDDKNDRRSIFAIAFSADGKYLASAGADRTVRLWDIDSGKELRQFQGAEYAVFKENDKKIERTTKSGASPMALYCVTFSPDGRQVAAGGLDKSIRIWDAESGELKQTLTGLPDFPYRLRYMANSEQLLCCGHLGYVAVRTLSDDGGSLFATTLSGRTHSADVSVDLKRLACGGDDGSVYSLALP